VIHSFQSPAEERRTNTESTAQGTLADILNKIFNVPMQFEGRLISKMAAMRLDSLVDDLNNDTLDSWAEIQEEGGVKEPTPLNPFMEKELLKDHDLSLDGSAFIRETGFQYVGPVSS
jgi:hypothetical protein